VVVSIDEILASEEGPRRTAALVKWLQSLFEGDATVPVLVGGAAVELYTLGAYTTGDVDLVGTVTPRVVRDLTAAGFKRRGRHWIHEAAQVFVEFPASALDPQEESRWVDLEGKRVLIISIEDLLVDRLGAWQYWKSSVDGANALRLWRAQRERIDEKRLKRRLAQSGWFKAWDSLVRFSARWTHGEPPVEEVERWANAGP
jgi:predicted nucleotidyltransferase